MNIWRLFPVSLFSILLVSCGGRSIIDDLQPKGQGDEPQEQKEPQSGDVIWDESFDLFNQDGGPDIQSDNFREDVQNPLSHVEFKSTE